MGQDRGGICGKHCLFRWPYKCDHRQLLVPFPGSNAAEVEITPEGDGAAEMECIPLSVRMLGECGVETQEGTKPDYWAFLNSKELLLATLGERPI